MNPEITSEQKEQLSTWAGQRDACLLEISAIRSDKEKLERINRELADSNTEITAEINQKKGGIEELRRQEGEISQKVSKEVAGLREERTLLETEISNFKRDIDSLSLQKDKLVEDIGFLIGVFNTLNDRVGLLEKVIGHVTEVSGQNTLVIENLTAMLNKNIQELINISNENIEKTNRVINELPKVFLEVQRKSLIREKIN